MLFCFWRFESLILPNLSVLFSLRVSVRTECGIVVRSFNFVSSLEGGLRRVAFSNHPQNCCQVVPIAIGISPVFSISRISGTRTDRRKYRDDNGSIPFYSKDVVFQIFLVVLNKDHRLTYPIQSGPLLTK